MSVVGKLFPHKKFVHNLPETLTNHDWLFICRKFKSSQGRCQPFTYQEVFNASEYPTCMQQSAISKANAHEYLVAAREEFETLYFDFKSTLNRLSTHNDVRIFLYPILFYPFILYLVQVFIEKLARPHSDKRVTQELDNISPILMNCFAHDIEELGGLKSKLFIEKLFTHVGTTRQLLVMLELSLSR